MDKSETRIIAYLGIISLLASLIVGLLGYSVSTQDINDMKNILLSTHVENNINLSLKYLKNTHGRLSLGDGTLLDKDGNSISGDHGLVDSVLEDLGDEATVFVREYDDFRRIATNIMVTEDERAIDTYLGKDHAAYENVIKGETYIGEANILGENYYTAYQPIKDQNENVIGILFVGLPTKELDDMINKKEMRISHIDKGVLILRALSIGPLIALVGTSVYYMNQPKEKDEKQIK